MILTNAIVNGSVSLRGVQVNDWMVARSRALVPDGLEALQKMVSWLLLPLSRKRVLSLIYSFFVNRRSSVRFGHHSLPLAVWVAGARELPQAVG